MLTERHILFSKYALGTISTLIMDESYLVHKKLLRIIQLLFRSHEREMLHSEATCELGYPGNYRAYVDVAVNRPT